MYIDEENIKTIIDKFVNDDYVSDYSLLKGHYCRPNKCNKNYSNTHISMQKHTNKIKSN